MKNTVVDLFGNEIPIENGEVIDDELSDTLKGRYAEFMVCAQLTKIGYDVIHVDAAGFDLVLKTDEGSFTVQVKSASRITNGRCIWHIYIQAGSRFAAKRKKRIITPYDADLLALFHSQFNTTIILPIKHNMTSYFSFPVSQVEKASIQQTLDDALEFLKR